MIDHRTRTLVPPSAAPAPAPVRAELAELIREYIPVVLSWTIDYFEDHAVVIGRLPSGHLAVTRHVYLDDETDRAHARRHASDRLAVAS